MKFTKVTKGFKKERRLSVLIAIFAEMLAYFVVKGFLEVRSDPQVRAFASTTAF